MSTAISDIVNKDISLTVMSALQKAEKSNKAIFYTHLKAVHRQHLIDPNLRVTHVKEYDISETPSYYWLAFEAIDAEEDDTADRAKIDVSEQAKQHIAELEVEFKYYKEHLQLTLK